MVCTIRWGNLIESGWKNAWYVWVTVDLLVPATAVPSIHPVEGLSGRRTFVATQQLLPSTCKGIPIIAQIESNHVEYIQHLHYHTHIIHSYTYSNTDLHTHNKLI